MCATVTDLDFFASRTSRAPDFAGRARLLPISGGRVALPFLLTCFRATCESGSDQMAIARQLTQVFSRSGRCTCRFNSPPSGCRGASQFCFVRDCCPARLCILTDTAITFGARRQPSDFYFSLLHSVKLQGDGSTQAVDCHDAGRVTHADDGAIEKGVAHVHSTAA